VDVIGARVVNRQGVELGTVSGLTRNGAQDLLQVQGSDGMLLVPMVPSYIESVDVAAREVRVDWDVDW
jgi:16S rRNA processing protein RimM